MGFSTVAASVIIFAGLLFFTSTLANAYFEAHRDTDRKQEDWQKRYEFERTTSFTIDSGNDNGNRLTLTATNTGSTSLDTDRLHLVVDGVWSTSLITSIKIEGSNSYDTWNPGHEIEVVANPVANPERAWLYVETGYGDLWVNPSPNP